MNANSTFYLQRPPDSVDLGDGVQRSHNRGRSLLSTGQHGYGPRYERLGEESSPSPVDRLSYRQGLPPLRVHAPTPNPYEEAQTPSSPVGNPADFQAAMGFAGLLVPDISLSQAPGTGSASYSSGDFGGPSPYGDSIHDVRDSNDYEHSYFASDSFAPESDRAPLNNQDNLQPISGTQEPSTPDGQRHDRSSFRTVSFSSPNSRPTGARLGDDLRVGGRGLTPPSGRSRSHSYGVSLTPDSQPPGSRKPSTSTAFSRAGSIVRAMSQRVVNLSGEAELIEESARREAIRASTQRGSKSTRTPRPELSEEDRWSDISSLDEEMEPRVFRKKDPMGAGPNYKERLPTAPVEKAIQFLGKGKNKEEPSWEQAEKAPNPLKGKSLGIFPAESLIRKKLCDVLVYPLTEPIILLLIVVQTVLLAVDASESVYEKGRSRKWGTTPIDYALLALFILFTVEVVARIIVSGLIFNAPEYGNGKKRSVKAAITEKYRQVFAPQRQSSLRAPQRTETSFSTPDLLRSFTAKQGEAIRTVEQAQRLQLARRAFLRHSFNRLDFLAVLAFWITFVISITGIEDRFHIYVFRMISCLRILRLLALTHGTAVRIHSLIIYGLS